MTSVSYSVVYHNTSYDRVIMSKILIIIYDMFDFLLLFVIQIW